MRLKNAQNLKTFKEHTEAEYILNILSISASEVLKTFLNIIVGLGCVVVIFHSYKPTGSVANILVGEKVI